MVFQLTNLLEALSLSFSLHFYVHTPHLGKTHATLTRSDGSTLQVPATWLPREARAGDLLLCSHEPGANTSSVTLELGVPDEVEEAIALEG